MYISISEDIMLFKAFSTGKMEGIACLLTIFCFPEDCHPSWTNAQGPAAQTLMDQAEANCKKGGGVCPHSPKWGVVLRVFFEL